MRKTKTLNLRVSAEFKRRLVEGAKKEKRSVTNYIEVVLAEHWRRKYSENTKGQKGDSKLREDE